MFHQSSKLKPIVLWLLLLTLLIVPQLTANVEAGYVPDPSHWPQECVVPDSGPWPPCATGGEDASPPSTGDCVIPASGPWPPCATGGDKTPDSNECIIPASGPWPPCVTGGGTPAPSTPDNSNECVIPPSGPWPPCATGGGSTPNTEPILISFTANKSWVSLTDVVKLSWHVENAKRVILRPLNSSQVLQAIDGLPGKGSYDFNMQWLCDGDGEVEFELLATQSYSNYEVIGSLKIASQINKWFFTLSDGTTPASQPCGFAEKSPAAQQSFENGSMVWLRDTNSIFVILNATDDSPATWTQRPNTFEEGMPVSDPALVPPDGLHQPIRGFGKLWRESLDIREALGWATDPEVGYTATYQGYNTCGATLCSHASFISDPSGEKLWHFQFGGRSGNLHNWWLRSFEWAE